jgi:hypothetical protein
VARPKVIDLPPTEPAPQRRAPHQSISKRVSKVLAGVLLLAALLQLALARLEATAPRPLSGDEKRYVEVATAWASGEPAQLDPFWPPGYPATMALVLRAGRSLDAVIALQILALLVAGGALAGIARASGAGAGCAALAGSLLVLNPQIAAFSRLFWPEILHLAVFLSALWLVIELSPADGRARPGEASPPLLRDERLRPLLWILLGTLLGVAIALKSLLLPLLALLVLIPFGAAPGRVKAVRGLLVALPLLGLLVPLWLHDHGRTGEWGLGGSARFNLWVGLTDRSPRSLVEDRTWSEYLAYRAGGATFAERQRALTQRLRDLVEARGLPATLAGQIPRQYFRLFDRESYFSALLPENGSRYLAGEGYRAAPHWLARTLGLLELALYAAILACAPFGLLRLVRERRRGAIWIVGLLGYQLVLFTLVHVKARYRLTILPLLILGAVWTVQSLVRSRERDPGAPSGRWAAPPISGLDVALGGGLGATLLYFAFAAP